MLKVAILADLAAKARWGLSPGIVDTLRIMHNYLALCFDQNHLGFTDDRAVCVGAAGAHQ
jgi:hypothetical protein